MLTGFAKRIESLIDRLGRDITHRTIVKSGPNYDPVLTPTNNTVQGVIFDYMKEQIDGTVIQKNDKEIIISTNLGVISKQDKIVDDGIEYSIEDIEEVQPGSEKLMYIIQGRA